MRIPQQFIDDLVSRVDIIDLIDSRVNLRKAGKNYQARCPFHSEKTPSFTVSPSSQMYHCFGCGASGNAITFLMEHDRMEFVESVETLADMMGMEVPRTIYSDQKVKPTKDTYAVLKQAADYFYGKLKENPADGEVVTYLKNRGLSGQSAKEFAIGYAPNQWDGLINEIGNKQDQLELLDKAGLVIKRESGGFYDRFRGRIIFPIKDRRGRIIAFGGRAIGDGHPKYLNSPETEVFHKGKELYGLYEAIQKQKKVRRFLVVEGYMDVVMLHQHGINYAVATLGTAISKDHLERMFRLSPEVVFCFDGDKAGRSAAWRALENVLPIANDGKEAFFVFLPEGEDPDSFVQKVGSIAFEDMICDEVIPLSTFMFNELKTGIDVTTPSGKARLIDSSKKYIRMMPAGAQRDFVVEELAKLTKSEVQKIEKHIFQEPTQPDKKSRPKGKWGAFSKKKQKNNYYNEYDNYYVPESTEEQQAKSSVQRFAIKMLLKQPDLASRVVLSKEIIQSKNQGNVVLREMVGLIKNSPGINAAQIIAKWSGTKEEKILSQLVLIEEPERDEETARAELDDALDKITADALEEEIEELSQKNPKDLTEKERETLVSLINKQCELR